MSEVRWFKYSSTGGHGIQIEFHIPEGVGAEEIEFIEEFVEISLRKHKRHLAETPATAEGKTI